MSEAGTKNALEEQLHRLQEENHLLKDQLAAHSSGSIDLKLIEANQKLKAQCDQLDADYHAVGEKNVDLVLQIEDLEEHLRTSQANESQLQGELEAHRKKIEEGNRILEERQATFQQRLLESSTQLSQHQNRVTELEADVRSRDSALEQERARSAGLEENRSALGHRVNELERLEAELKGQLDVSQRHLESEKARADALDKQAHELQARLTESEEHLTAQRESSRVEGERLRKTQDDLETARAEAAGLKMALAQEQEEANRLKAELSSQSNELAQTRARVQSLENNIAELKQVVLEGGRSEAAPAGAEAPHGEEVTGSPQEVLMAAMTDVLGSTGKVLVNRVYYRCGIDTDTSDADELDMIVKSLEDTSARLVQTPEQRTRLTTVLEEFRRSVAMGTPRVTLSAPAAPVAATPTARPEPPRPSEPARVQAEPFAHAPVPPPAPAAIPEPEPEPTPMIVEPALQQQPPAAASEPVTAESLPTFDEEPELELVIRKPGEKAAQPAEEDVDDFLSRLNAVAEEEKAPAPPPVVEAAAPVVEPEPEPAPRTEEPVFLSATDLLASMQLDNDAEAARVLEHAAEEAKEEGAAAEEQAEADMPLEVLEYAQEGRPLVWTDDASLLAEVDKGMTMLKHLNMDESFEFFSKLHQEHPDVVQVEAGLFYNYASFSCWMEAYEIGRRMLPVMIRRPDTGQFVTTMTTVLNERIGQSRSMAEKKRCLLELAELHLNDTEQALDYLRRAKRIPNPIKNEGRIDYYLTCLLAGTPEDRSAYVRNYMASVADSERLFTHLEDIYKENRHKQQAPVARAIVALGRSSAEKAHQTEAEAGELLAPVAPTPDLLEQTWSKAEPGILKLFLDALIPRAKVSPRFPAPRFHTWLDHCKPAPDGWKPKEIANADNQAIFQLGRITVHRYEGPDKFLIKASPEPEVSLIVHQDVEKLPEGQIRFFVLSALYQVKRRHLHLYRAAEALDNEGRVRLLMACRDSVLQSGVDITDALDRKMEAFSVDTPDFSNALQALLDTLYEHTLSDEFDQLREFMFAPTPFRDQLEGAADRFATRLVGLSEASLAAARDTLGEGEALDRARREGFRALYRRPLDTHREARLRLQRIWLGPLNRAHQ